MKNGDIPVWSAKQRAELAISLGYKNTTLNLEHKKRDKFWIPRLLSRFIIKSQYCREKSGHRNFEVFVLGKSASCFRIVTGKERSSEYNCPRCHGVF